MTHVKSCNEKSLMILKNTEKHKLKSVVSKEREERVEKILRIGKW